MDKTIKVILLTNSERIISEIDEVGAEIGEPDCKLIKPYDVKDLVPTQKNLTIGNLEKTKDVESSKDEILLVEKDGEYFIMDGHHRLANEILKAINLLSNSSKIFAKYAIEPLTINKSKLSENLGTSNILITKLNPIIGYNKAAEIYKLANKNNISIKDVILEKNLMTELEYDKLMDYKSMTKAND